MDIIILSISIFILILSVYSLGDSKRNEIEMDARLDELQEQLNDIEDKLNRKI